MKTSCRSQFWLLLALAPLLLTLCHPITAAASAPQDEIVILDGRVTGRITSDMGVTYLLDMPIPDEAYPAKCLTVEYASFTEHDVLKALQMVGQSTEGSIHTDSDGFLFSGNWKAVAAAQLSHEDAASQAVAIGLAFFDAMGIPVEREPKSVARPYEFDDSDQKYWTFVSEPQAYSDYNRSQFNSPRRQRTRPRQSEYTSVEFAVLLDGMRMIDNPSYPAGYADEPDAKIGFSVTARVIVSDSGLLVEAAAGNIPRIISCAPIDPLPDWETFICSYIKSLDIWPNRYDERTFFNENIGKDVIVYASQPVVTGILPRLETISQYEWVPTWTVVIDEIPVR